MMNPEWTTMYQNGIKIEAIDFLDGVLVKLIEGNMHHVDRHTVFCRGYYVQEQLGDMDGPALRPRKKMDPVYGIQLRVEGEVPR
jgi:hypothetical protein